MEVAIGNVVTIILGIVTFIGGAMVLNTIMSTTSGQIEQLAESQKADYLQSFPPRRQLYVPLVNVEHEDGAATIPFGINNPTDENKTFFVDFTFESSTAVPSLTYETTLRDNYTLGPDEKDVFLGVITSDVFPSDNQATFVVNLTNTTGGVVMQDVVFVS